MRYNKDFEEDTEDFPVRAVAHLENKYNKTISELIIENGYTWFQYTVKKNYY